MAGTTRLGKTIAITIVCAMVIAGCTSFQISGIEVPQVKTEGTVIGSFAIKVAVHKFLGNSGGTTLFNVSADAMDPEIVQAIRNEVAYQGGTSAVNVKIVYKASFVNILLNAITFSIYAPATAYITGTILK